MTRGRADEPGAHRLVVRFGAEIMEEGFTSVPNLVLNHYAALGITGAEMLFIIHVWQFWWSERDNPHPSSRVLAERMGVDQRTIRNYTASLEAKGFLTTHERIIPGEGQRANVYDFAKLLKTVGKAAKAGRRGPGGGVPPRNDSSGEGRKEFSGGRRKNVSAQRLKKISADGRKDDSALEYVGDDRLLDEDLSNIRQASTEQNLGHERTLEERRQPTANASAPAAAPVPSLRGDGKATPDSPAADSREWAERGDAGLIAEQADRVPSFDADAPAALGGDPARDDLHAFAEVVAREFNDQASFRATLSRIVNLYHRAGLPIEEFVRRLDAARQRTKERTGAVRTLAGVPATNASSRKNKTPYFFAILEDLLGLRESPPLPARSASEGETPAGGVPDASAPRGAERRPSWSPPRRGNEAPQKRASAADREVGRTPAHGISEDGRMIRTVVSTFGRQFADHAAADALGTWAVTLWQESHLSREQFLAAASEASVELLRDHAAVPSAAQFQNCLVGALGRLNGGGTIEPGDRREQPMPSVSLADGTAPRNQARE